MVNNPSTIEAALEGFNRSVAAEIDAGRYDFAHVVSDEAAAFYASSKIVCDQLPAAIDMWLTRGEAMEVDDDLHEALNARETAYRLAELQRAPPARQAAALAKIAINLRLLDRNSEAATYLAVSKKLTADLPDNECSQDLLRAKCLQLSIESDLLCDEANNSAAANLKARALVGWRRIYPESEFPRGHPELAAAITDDGWLAGEMNDDMRMSERYAEALAANERLYPHSTHPNGHPELANAYNNMAYAHMQLSQFIEAEIFLVKAIRMREKVYPPARFPNGRAEMAVSYMNLGILLVRRGELFRAREPYDRALHIRDHVYPEVTYPNGHSEILRTLLARGKLSVERRQDAVDALPLYERAYAMADRLYPDAERGPGHATLAWVLHDCGLASMLVGDDDSSAAVLKRAERLFDLGSTPNFLHGSTLAALAELSAHRGDFETCRHRCQRAKEIYEAAYPSSIYGTGHLNLANGLARLARVALLIDEAKLARDLLLKSRDIHSAVAERFYRDSALVEGLMFSAQSARLTALYLSLEHEGDLREAYGILFRDKGAVRRMQSQKTNLMRGHRGEEAFDALTSQLHRLRSDLAQILFAPFETRFAAHRREKFVELTEQKELLEQEIARKIGIEAPPSMSAAEDALSFSAGMPADAVLIDVIRFARTRKVVRGSGIGLEDVPAYCVFVVGQRGVIARVDLGNASEVDATVDEWRRDIEIGIGDLAAATKASQRIWKPIEAVLPAGTKLILVSPDGGLHGLPWQALESPSGVPALETYRMALLTEPWLFPYARSRRDTTERTLVVGDIDYGAPSVEMQHRRPSWEALPQSKRELESVVQSLGPSLVLAGSHATADALLEKLSNNRVVHVVTHGFYIDPTATSAFDLDPKFVDPLPEASQKERLSASRQSRYLSGLVLAGANRWPTLDADGLPTSARSLLAAEEIAGSDASAADLVVLSACKTNLGQVMHGEGVLGLTAAFHEAGARCVITSLWDVDDQATRRLMTDFYENLRAGDCDAPEALRRAQLSRLSRNKGVRTDTRDWAAFVPSVSSWSCFEAWGAKTAPQ